MNLYRVSGFALFALGIILLIFGVLATQRASEKVVETITGHFTSGTMWYFIGGIVLMVGGFGLIRVRSKRR